MVKKNPHYGHISTKTRRGSKRNNSAAYKGISTIWKKLGDLNRSCKFPSVPSIAYSGLFVGSCHIQRWPRPSSQRIKATGHKINLTNLPQSLSAPVDFCRWLMHVNIREGSNVALWLNSLWCGFVPGYTKLTVALKESEGKRQRSMFWPKSCQRIWWGAACAIAKFRLKRKSAESHRIIISCSVHERWNGYSGFLLVFAYPGKYEPRGAVTTSHLGHKSARGHVLELAD